MPEKKTYRVGSDVIDIPVDKVDVFLDKYPDAEEMASYVIEGDTIDVPVNNEAKLLEKYPDAKPTYVKKKDEVSGQDFQEKEVPSTLISEAEGYTPPEISVEEEVKAREAAPEVKPEKTEFEEELEVRGEVYEEESKKRYQEELALYGNALNRAKESISQQREELNKEFPEPTVTIPSHTAGFPIISYDPEYKERLDLINLSEKYINEIESKLLAEGGKGGLNAAKLRTKNFEDLATLGWSKVFDVRKVKKIADKVGKGEQLNQDEMTTLALYGFKEDVSKNVEIPLSYDVVGGIIDMIPYMVNIAATGGIGSGVSKAAGKVLKEGTKKAIGKYATRGANYLLGKSVQALAFPSTYEGTIERQIGEVGYDEKGNIKVTEGESPGKAFLKSYGSTIAEIGVEGFRQGVFPTNKILSKSKFTNLIRNEAQFGKFGEELAEEFVTAALQAPIEGQSLEETFTPRMIATTTLTVGAMSGAVSATDFVAGKTKGEGVAKIRTDMMNLGNLLSSETKKKVDDIIDSDKPIPEKARDLEFVVDQGKKDKDWKEEEVMTVFKYADARNKDNTFNNEVVEARTGEIKEEEPKAEAKPVKEEKPAEIKPEPPKKEDKPQVNEDVQKEELQKEKAVQKKVDVDEKEVLTKKEKDEVQKEDKDQKGQKRREGEVEKKDVVLKPEKKPKVKPEQVTLETVKTKKSGKMTAEALGKTVETKEIKIDGEKVGFVEAGMFDNDIRMNNVRIEEEGAKGIGAGKQAYKNLNEEAKKRGGVLVSSETMSNEAENVWKSLVKEGVAEKVDDVYKFKKVEDAKKADVVREEGKKPTEKKEEKGEPVGRVREVDKAKAAQVKKESIEKIGDISKKKESDLISEAQSVEELQHLMQTGKVKFSPKFNQKKEQLVKEDKLEDDTKRIKAIEDQALKAPDYSKEISKKVDSDLKTKKQKLTEKEEEVKGRLNERLQRLSGSKFALKEGEKNPDVLKDMIGVVGDLSELGIIKLEKGIDHVTTKLKEYLSNIDPENIDKYKEDIAENYNITKPKEVDTKTFKTQKQADAETDAKAEQRAEASDPLTLSEPTWFDKFITKFQNKYRRVDKLITEARKKGNVISDEIDVSLQTELMPGRAIKKIRDKEEQIIKGKPKGKKSLADRAKKDGVDLETLGTYMLAKHAAERNNFKIQERNAEIDEKIAATQERIKQTDNQSAITRLNDKIKRLEEGKIRQEEVDILNKKAEAYIDKIQKSKKADKYEQYATEVQEQLIEARQKELVEYGLVDQELIDVLNETYENYVPYYVLSKQVDKGVPGQRSTDVRGKDVFKATSLIDVEAKDRSNPITQALLEYDKTVVRGEKNVANKSLLDFADQVDNDIMEVVTPKYVRRMNEDGYYESVPTGLEGIPQSEQLHLKVDGKPVVIHIKDPDLMRAMTGSGTQRSINVLNKINNYLRFVNTLYNPEFVLTNLTRDLQTAAINISAEGEKGIKRKFTKNLLKAMKGIWQNEMGNLESEWSQIVDELRDLGGEVGWLNTENIEELNDRLIKQFDNYNKQKTDAKLKSALNTAAHYIESVNKTIEMTSRVAAYKAAIDSGVSKQQAARLAKNLTVNFNKKGELGSLMDSLYLFANAGVQGSAILLKNVGTSRKVQALVTSIAVGSFLLNYMNSAINDEEYEKIPDGVKERNLIIMHPSGNYNKIPLPYGYNIFKVLGDKMYETATGKERPGNASVDLFKSTMNAFNPVSSSTLGQSISPTLLDPFVQVGENKNWFGSEIKPEQPPYGAQVPESTLYFESVRPASKKIAKDINELTGGTMSTKGYVDISPEYIDHFTDYVSGGLGRFMMNSINTGRNVLTGEDIPLNNIPFARQFYGEVSAKADLGIIYKTLNDSWNKEFNEVERDRFNKSLSRALKNRLITPDDFSNYKENFIKGQMSVRISKNNPDLTRDQIRRRLK
jgi:hypothetical protein